MKNSKIIIIFIVIIIVMSGGYLFYNHQQKINQDRTSLLLDVVSWKKDQSNFPLMVHDMAIIYNELKKNENSNDEYTNMLRKDYQEIADYLKVDTKKLDDFVKANPYR